MTLESTIVFFQPVEMSLQNIHHLIRNFLSPDVRAKLNLPPEAVRRVSSVSDCGLTLEASRPAEKRRRAFVENGPCVSAWERRRGCDELESFKAAHERDREQWQTKIIELERYLRLICLKLCPLISSS